MSVNTVIDNLVKADNDDQRRIIISQYLRDDIPQRNDWLSDTYDLKDANQCMGVKSDSPIDGAKCANLIEQCIAGDNLEECTKAWNELPWAQGINVDNMDVAVVRNLLRKLGINHLKPNAVEAWVESNKGRVAPHDTLVRVLKTFVDKVNSPTGNPSDINAREVVNARLVGLIPVRVGLTRMAGGAQVGGASHAVRSYVNFVMTSDYLKNQLVMMGGGDELKVPQVTPVLKAQFEDLRKALETKGKKIDPVDEKRIYNLIDKLQRTQDKAVQASLYIQRLKTLIHNPKFNAAEIKDSGLTAQMLKELTETHKNLLDSVQRKSWNFVSILESVSKVLEDHAEMKDDLKAIRDQLTKAGPATQVAALPAKQVAVLPAGSDLAGAKPVSV